MPLQKLAAQIVKQNKSKELGLQLLVINHRDLNNDNDLINYIATDMEDDGIEKQFKKIPVKIQSFHFTGAVGEEDYSLVLNRFKSVTFEKCTFDITYLRLESTETYYRLNCIFQKEWYIHGLHNEKNSTIFHQCTFKGYVYSSIHEINKKIFSNCKFNNNVEFAGTVFNALIFEGQNNIAPSVNFNFLECEFNEKFILNRIRANLFRITDCTFNNKFEFKENNIHQFTIDNSNFKKVVDTYETKFERFSITKSIFDDFVGFEKCEFGPSEKAALFRYATFLSFVNFRKTNFRSGLDIKNINLKESPNFLEVEITDNNRNTPRETYRIIKHSFEKIGNNIEANKFFVKEMRKYKEELNRDSPHKKSERVILWLNEIISDFGQSYIKPICWIFTFAALYTLMMYAHDNNWVYRINPYFNNTISILLSPLNLLDEISKNILPFGKFLKDGMEFTSLLFYILFTSLSWQTIVAVKRHTKK